jgi:hypothetical protein
MAGDKSRIAIPELYKKYPRKRTQALQTGKRNDRLNLRKSV